MAKKKKLDKVKLVKEMSRDRIGTVKTEQVQPDRRRTKLDKIADREAQQEIDEN